MITWRDPIIEVPSEGAVVVALSWHGKEIYPSSMEIIGGIVEYAKIGEGKALRWRVQTNDDSGHGGYCFNDEEIDAWIPAKEFELAFPEFLKINGLTN